MTALSVGDDVPTPHLRTTFESDWACIWLSLEGELVAPTVPVFERALGEAIRLDRRKIVLLTMGLAHADAAGLASIDRAKETARARGIKLAVRSSRRARTGRSELGSSRGHGSRLQTQWWPAISAAVRRPDPVGALRLHTPD